jgi:hypothetical protein
VESFMQEHFNSPSRSCPHCGGYDNRSLGDRRCWGYREGNKVFCTNEAANRGSEKVPGGNTFRHWFGGGECKTCGRDHGVPVLSLPHTPIERKVVPFKKLPEEIEGQWDFHWEDGELITRVIRYRENGEKRYGQIHLEGDEWVWGMGRIPHLLYRLPDLLALDKRQPLLFVEGEKAAEACIRNGLFATTNIGGAGKKWSEDYTRWLSGRRIIFIPDNDEVGQKHMLEAANAMKGKASVKLMPPLPGVGPKGDAYDFFLNHSPLELAEFCKTVEWQHPTKYFYDIDEYDLIPPVKWLLEPMFIERGLTLTIGESEVGKSFLTIHYALRIATEAKRQVIYLGLESFSQYPERIRAWLSHYQKKAQGYFKLSDYPLQLMDTSNVKVFIKLVQDAGITPAMLVIDTYHAATVGADEISGKDTGLIVENLKLLRDALNTNVNCIHHLNASGLRERGHTSLKAAVDTALVLRSEGDGVVVECNKQRNAKHFQDLSVNWAYTEEGNRIAVESQQAVRVDFTRLGKNDQKLLRTLGAELHRARGLRFQQILDLTSMPRSSLINAMSKCRKAGWIMGGDDTPNIITNEGLEIIGFSAGDISEY